MLEDVEELEATNQPGKRPAAKPAPQRATSPVAASVTPKAAAEDFKLFAMPAEAIKETLAAVRGLSIEERDCDATDRLYIRLQYKLESLIASDPNGMLYVLIAVTFGSMLVLGALWQWATPGSDMKLWEAMWLTFQVFAAGGTGDFNNASEKVIFAVMLIVGLFVFAILVGFITDMMADFMESIVTGRSKVSETGHTLVLGWNESTPRLVAQIAFVRRAWLVENETLARRLCWWLRVAPSTPVAAAPVVLMCLDPPKADMDEVLATTLAERGISPLRTTIGRHVICRHGDPTNAHHLVRVNAQRAARIVVMMKTQDDAEAEETDGIVRGGATIRAVLALRHVLLSSKDPRTGEPCLRADLSVIVQLSGPAKESAVGAATWLAHDGSTIVRPLDLTAILNQLMFDSAAQPGLAAVLLELFDFDSACLRACSVAALERKLRSDGSRRQLAGATVAQAAGLWRDAILCGVASETCSFADGGFAVDPSRVIERDDTLLLLSHSPFPTAAAARGGAKVAAGAQYTASGGATEALLARAHDDAKLFGRKRQNVIVCGWRSKWNATPTLLCDRLHGLALDLKPGSEIILFNALSPSQFSELIAQGGLAPLAPRDGEMEGRARGLPRWKIADAENVSVAHFQGDAACREDLEALLELAVLDTAIVFGSTAATELSGSSRDTRVLATLLQLRALSLEQQARVPSARPIHVVGENEDDMTSLLALAPRLSAHHASCQKPGKQTPPDFVNTHAIMARVLAAALAYPKMTPAVEDLFDGHTPSGAAVMLVNPAACLPLGEPIAFDAAAACVSASFDGDVSRQTSKRFLPGCVCLGFVNPGGELTVVPPPHSTHKYEQGDRLVVIAREAT